MTRRPGGTDEAPHVSAPSPSPWISEEKRRPRRPSSSLSRKETKRASERAAEDVGEQPTNSPTSRWGPNARPSRLLGSRTLALGASAPHSPRRRPPASRCDRAPPAALVDVHPAQRCREGESPDLHPAPAPQPQIGGDAGGRSDLAGHGGRGAAAAGRVLLAPPLHLRPQRPRPRRRGRLRW
jgi:hypothetical protein